MALIGTFVPTSNGFTGRIKTLLLDADLTISVLREPAGDKAPDFLITLRKKGEGPFVGAARRRRTEKGVDFVSVRIDDPSFGRPIFAGLFPSEQSTNLHNLYWTRLSGRSSSAVARIGITSASLSPLRAPQRWRITHCGICSSFRVPTTNVI